LKRRKKLEGVGDILAKMKQTTELGKHLEHAEIWEHWPEIVGETVAKHARPKSIKDLQLRIEADSAVWMHKINYRKWQILKKINRLARKELVSDIYIVLLDDGESMAEE
jgi:predicted nucleic acid-binding Zn ribbon protein